VNWNCHVVFETVKKSRLLCVGDHRYKGKNDLGADEQQITAFPDVKETEITE
jgi:hypothetical protein